MQWTKAEIPQIEFIDVTVGDTKEDSACIFEVNGKTVVIDRREKETVDGITIYVQEVYPVNTETQENDRCEFLYSIEEENDKNGEEAVKKEVIGEKIINFFLGKRESAEEKEKEAEESDEEKEPNEETRVLVNGYDVTGATVSDITGESEQREESTTEKKESTSEEKGLFGRLISWIFD
jgi:hypothetical protein